LGETLVRDARVCQERQGRLLLPKRAEVQHEVRDVRLQRRGEARRRRRVAHRLRAEGVDRRRRGKDRRAREESGELRTDLATGPHPRRGRDEAFPRDENAHHRGVREGQRREAGAVQCQLRGRRTNCNGAGVIYTDLAMMAGVATTCEECEGKRFEASVLEYHLGGRDISEVLAMSVTEAEEFFGAGQARTPAAHAILDRLADVGLGYLILGQPLTTLSGGERQRLK